MSTFVLVHGGWSGANGWRHVRELLAAGGHEVFTPSLTGIGERVHLASPQIDLTTHVQDVVNQILFEGLDDNRAGRLLLRRCSRDGCPRARP